MIVIYKNQNYNVGYPKTLQKMKKQLQKLIPELTKRELMIMNVIDQNKKKLLEQNKYQDIVQSYKQNQGPKLQCYILFNFLNQLDFQLNQQYQQLQNEFIKNQKVSQELLIQFTKNQNEKQQSIASTDNLQHLQQQITQKLEQQCASEQQNQQNEFILSSVIPEKSAHKTMSLPLNKQSYSDNNEYQQNQNVQIIEYQLDQIEQSRSYMDRDNIESQLQSIYPNCQHCNLKIEQLPYFLTCFHIYHQQCLKEYLTNQIQRLSSKLFCHCNRQITHPCQILGTLDLDFYTIQLLNNQLNEIKKKYKSIKRCPNKSCSFFVIIINNQICISFCPLCLMQVKLI